MRSVLAYIKPYKWWVLLSFLFVFLQAMADLYLPSLMGDIVDQGIVYGDTAYILKTGIFMLIVSFGGVLCAVVVSLLSSRIGLGVSRDIRRGVFHKVSDFAIAQYDEIGTSSLITRTTNDVVQVQTFVMMGLRMLVMAPLLAVGGIVMAIYTNARLSLIFVAVVPILLISVALVGKKAMPMFQSLQKKIDHLTLVLREQLTGMKIVRMFNRVEDEKERFQASNTDLTQTALRVNRIIAFMMPIMMLVMNSTTLVIVWVGAGRIDAGNMQVGDLIAFIQYAMQILMSFVMMSLLFVVVPRAQASAVRIAEVLDKEVVGECAASEVVRNIPEPYRGEICFEHVTFSYPGAESPALSDVSFTIHPGKMNAMIGGTGAGKTAILQLLLGFYRCSAGKITIDGVDIAKISQEALRQQIAYVPQKNVLFTGTIEQNLRYGDPDAGETRLKEAAEVSQSLGFIEQITDGFQAEVSQGGKNFSGGQRQRLAIARALVRNTAIYVFDDSFSALDFKTDAILRQAMKTYLQNRTIFMVAQRLHTIQDADQIIVLDEGKVVGVGKHEELLKSCPVYQETAKSQMPEEGYGHAEG